MKNSNRLYRNTGIWVSAILLTASGCSINKSSNVEIKIPNLPPNFVSPCKDLNQLHSTDAVSNYEWAIDTVNKYNDCAIRKDAVTDAYQSLVNQINHK